MLDMDDLVQDGLAVAAKIAPAAPMFSEQMFAELVCGWRLGWFTFKLFGYSVSHKIGDTDAARIKPCPQVGLELRWQPDCDRHGDRPAVVLLGVIHSEP
jgi:hypothetical protein